MSDTQHPAANGTLAAWALHACPADEAARVGEHVAGCPRCAGEADRLRGTAALIATVAEEQPPPSLRGAVLSAARARRRPGTAADSVGPAEAYAVQVGRMDALLGSLTPAHWRSPLPGYVSVGELVVHLTGNDTAFATGLGLASRSPAAGPHGRWREQARAVVAEVSADVRVLDRETHLAGPRPGRAPGRTALAQRAFETWTHADDIRSALGRPADPPPAAHLRLIVDLGTGLLPRALRATGREHPRRTARLRLTGPGSGEWNVPLAPGGVPGPPDVIVTADAEEFCRLLANRRLPEDFPHHTEGDPALAADLLHAAATLGCD